MTGTDVWPAGQVVEKMLLPVSERAPILGTYATHTARRRVAYDMHFALEFGIVLSGRMRRDHRDGSVTIGPGGVWYGGIWEPHGWSVLRAPCRVVVLLILPQAMSRLRFEESLSFDPMKFFLVPPARRPQPSKARVAAIRELGERLWSVCAERPPHHAVWIRLLFQECLLLLDNDSDEFRQDQQQQSHIEFAGRVNRAIEAVYRHKRLITVDEAAQLCGMSRNRFNQTFQSLIGISFAKYSLRYRLSGAATSLAQSSDPLKSVAVEWGFTDASHLHRCFMQHYGCGPNEYRDRARGA